MAFYCSCDSDPHNPACATAKLDALADQVRAYYMDATAARIGVEVLREENERLRAALRPFADEYHNWSTVMPEDVRAYIVSEHDEDVGRLLGDLGDRPAVTYGDIKRAREAVDNTQAVRPERGA